MACGHRRVAVEDHCSACHHDLFGEAFGQRKRLALVTADALVHFLALTPLGLVHNLDGTALAVEERDGVPQDTLEERYQFELSGEVTGEFRDAVKL